MQISFVGFQPMFSSEHMAVSEREGGRRDDMLETKPKNASVYTAQ